MKEPMLFMDDFYYFLFSFHNICLMLGQQWVNYTVLKLSANY